MSSLITEHDPEPVYLVYCTGRPSQSAIKPTRESAQDAADRLAIAYPGHEFMVMECIYTASAARPARAGAPAGTLNF